MKRIAFADVRDIANSKLEPVLSPDGEVLDVVDRISVTPSGMLSTAAAATVRSVFSKSEQVRVELQDKRAAPIALAKRLKLFDDALAPANVTVNHVNAGALDALEVARRVAFLLAAARHATPRPVTVEAKAIKAPQSPDGG